MVGAPGFEPGNGGTKNRCLTAWRRPNDEAFSSQVDTLGDSENATNKITEHFQAKWIHLATRKMRPNYTSISVRRAEARRTGANNPQRVAP